MASEPITVLQRKRIVLGVTGSIAVYKAVDLASKLTQAGAHVTVIMTASAQKFVSALTFQSITGRPVYTDMWSNTDSGNLPSHIAHVAMGEETELVVIAPATANTIAKLAAGMADNLLTVTALSARCPLMVAPAMDGAMYGHKATQANVETLKARGVTIIEPEEGRFASGLHGRGRLPDPINLLGLIRQQMGKPGMLAGKKVIVTAGGTREAIDPVRFISNYSSGKQGYALAQAAIDAGANVTLVSTVATLPVPIGASLIHVNTAEEMLQAVDGEVKGTDVLIMAAAVADFRPSEAAAQKIKKSGKPDETLKLELARTPDVLKEVYQKRKARKWPRVTVGFAAESEDLLANARKKLEAKGMDMIVANDITRSDSGFGTDTNRVTIIHAGGGEQSIGPVSKTRVSEIIIERVARLLEAKS